MGSALDRYPYATDWISTRLGYMSYWISDLVTKNTIIRLSFVSLCQA
jgi:hypothetical protein